MERAASADDGDSLGIVYWGHPSWEWKCLGWISNIHREHTKLDS